MGNENKIGSFNDYIDKTTFTTKGHIKLFRGVSNKEYKNIPGIGREIEEHIHNTLSVFEETMIEKAKTQMPELFINDKYPIQALMKLQHYGLPTRLLDFTTSSLVALYFACKEEDSHDKDGKVLICEEKDENVFNCYHPFVNAIADMSFHSIYTQRDFYEYIENLRTKFYWRDSEFSAAQSGEIKEKFLSPKFLEPEMSSERIKRQQGIFLLFPNKISGRDFILENLVELEHNKYKQLTIPASLKTDLLNKLVGLGIRESYLFPEPEHICHDILSDLRSRVNIR